MDGGAGDQDAGFEQPAVPELVGVAEIAQILGVSVARAAAVVKSDQFPAPVAKLIAGEVWTRPSLDGFVEMWTSQPAGAHQLATVIEHARYRLHGDEWRRAARLELVWDETGERRRADRIVLRYLTDLGVGGAGLGTPVDLLFAGQDDADPMFWAKVALVSDDEGQRVATWRVISGPLQP
jgi:hypothetical protein